MKRLFLLRHAKAERDSPSGEDFDRPLAARGRRDAEAMGRYLEDQGTIPDVIVFSTSRRTAETLDRVTSGWRKPPPTQGTRALYLAEAGGIAACVRALPDDCDSAMLVGHNPGMEEFAGALAQHGAKEARRRLEENFPTCALAIVALDIRRWSELSADDARLETFVIGKELGADA